MVIGPVTSLVDSGQRLTIRALVESSLMLHLWVDSTQWQLPLCTVERSMVTELFH